jgi:hypothetical protein
MDHPRPKNPYYDDFVLSTKKIGSYEKSAILGEEKENP